jgi:hypothetical protein
MEFPRMVRIRQSFHAESLPNPVATARSAILESSMSTGICSNGRIAVTAGSRGIHRIAEITKAVVEAVRELGGEPFILPAMGSHGGATAEGQVEILASYGITEENVGAPIEATMEVVQVGEVDGHIPVVLNRLAMESDGVVLINRIKPHTAFRGRFESGLMKMMTIGLGSHKGATLAHSMGATGLPRMIPAWGRIILENAPILQGLAVLENAYEKTSKVVALAPDEFESQEPRLLEEARELMPRLPVQRLDVLIVDQIGKNISGTGMDPNIIGRIWLPGIKEPDSPTVDRIVVLNLTEETHGNANGIGLADITTRRLVDGIDYKATYANVLTTTFLNRAYIPVVAESDKEAIEMALDVLRTDAPQTARVLRIRSSLELENIWASESLVNELSELPDVEILGELEEMRFDQSGGFTQE